MLPFLFLCFWLYALLSDGVAVDTSEDIRVLLQEGVPRVTVSSSQDYQMLLATHPPVSAVGNGEVTIVAHPKGMVIQNTLYPVQQVELQPLHTGELFQVGRFHYRGRLQIRLAPAGKLRVINIVPLRYYLYGVLPQEISPDWKEEALKAQAIAARTYTLYRKATQAGKEYDIKSEIWDQVYKGYAREDPRTNRAVDETFGEILTYEGRPIAAYYHADSGGYTEDSQYVWSVPQPYLKAVRAAYGADSPYAVWEATLSSAEIGHLLRQYGYTVGTVHKITILQRSPTGRVVLLRVYHSQGSLTLKGTEFRLMMGVNTIRSTLFTLQHTGTKVHFTGRGWGHGVGLSQWGAKEMAELGFTYQEILQFYYQGAILTHLTHRKGMQ
jgi:stage II sporulation protein D